MDGMVGRKNKQDGAEQDDRLLVEDLDQETLDQIVAERDRLSEDHDRILRAAADAQNRLRTARKDVQESHRQGVTGVARDVITALDSFDVALSQDMSSATVESIVAGVRSIREELIRALGRHGVGLIEAAPGDELDPQRHQAMMEQPTDRVPAGHVLAMVQVGYVLDERVIRPAKVIVAAGDPGEPAPVGEPNFTGPARVEVTNPDALDVEDPSAEIPGETPGEDEAGEWSESPENPRPESGVGTPDAEGVYHIDDVDEDPDRGPSGDR